MKVTERALKAACLEANRGPLKTWPFGLRVERRGISLFEVYKIHRHPGLVDERLLAVPLAAKETMCFIEGFTAAIALANQTAGSVPDEDPETAS